MINQQTITTYNITQNDVDISQYDKKSSKKLWGGDYTPKIRGINGIKEQLKRHDSLKLSLIFPVTTCFVQPVGLE